MALKTWDDGYGSTAAARSALVLKRGINDAGSAAAIERAAVYAVELENGAKTWQIRCTPIKKRSVKGD